MGTGTIIDSSGLILTVNYVVMGGRTIEVMLERGRTLLRRNTEVLCQIQRCSCNVGVRGKRCCASHLLRTHRRGSMHPIMNSAHAAMSNATRIAGPRTMPIRSWLSTVVLSALIASTERLTAVEKPMQ